MIKLEIKYLSFLFFFLLSLNFCYAAGNILVSVEDISPNEVVPGQDLAIKINLINSESETVEINSIDLDLKNNFIFKSSTDDFSNKLFCSDCTKTVIYYLNSKPGLESGIYSIKFNVIYDEIFSSEEEILIKVTGEPNLVIEPIVDKNNIYPGNNFDVSFKIKNYGTNDARNIKLETQSNEIGFNNQNLIFLDELKQKEEKIVDASIVISENVENGFYLMPFKIKYEDNQNNKYEVEENLGLNILNKANIVVQNIKFPSQVKVGKQFDLTLKIENDGAGKAKNVRVKLDGDFQGNLDGFYGTIDKDDDMPQIFTLIPNSLDANNLKMTIMYEDDFGEHSQDFEYIINVKNNWTIYYIVIGILILLIGFFYVKHLLKNDKKTLNY